MSLLDNIKRVFWERFPPVADIAFACGFNDSTHFPRVFAARKELRAPRGTG